MFSTHPQWRILQLSPTCRCPLLINCLTMWLLFNFVLLNSVMWLSDHEVCYTICPAVSYISNWIHLGKFSHVFSILNCWWQWVDHYRLDHDAFLRMSFKTQPLWLVVCTLFNLSQIIAANLRVWHWLLDILSGLLVTYHYS